jgi:hypothetical protein
MAEINRMKSEVVLDDQAMVSVGLAEHVQGVFVVAIEGSIAAGLQCW